MKVELHLIQNLAPSCLNRDDTGTPKDCDFGGVRRARISSQSWKRAIRESFADADGVAPQRRAVRTRRVVDDVASRLEAVGRPREEAERAVVAALAAVGLGVDAATLATQYLLFLPTRAFDALARLLDERWEDLAAARSMSSLAKKGAALEPDLMRAVKEVLAPVGASPEIALFGRMIADNRDWNVDAACQVAHAISTHASAVEFDFFTAMDDLLPRGAGGAGMLGTSAFNAPCFYRYLLVDMDQLADNLAADELEPPAAAELSRATLHAFLRGAISTLPSGRQNAMAAHNPPSFILAVVRDAGAPMSLANAFARPVPPRTFGKHDDLVEGSIVALDAHFGDVLALFGRRGVRRAAWCALSGAVRRPLRHLEDADMTGGGLARRVATVDELLAAVTEAVSP